MVATPIDELDGTDIFEEGLENLFGEVMPAKGDPLQLYTYTPTTGAPSLTCRVPPQRQNSNFAHFVWNASLRMADALTEGRLRVEGEDVLEMGAGAGIPGLMAARMGAKNVRFLFFLLPSALFPARFAPCSWLLRPLSGRKGLWYPVFD